MKKRWPISLPTPATPPGWSASGTSATMHPTDLRTADSRMLSGIVAAALAKPRTTGAMTTSTTPTNAPPSTTCKAPLKNSRATAPTFGSARESASSRPIKKSPSFSTSLSMLRTAPTLSRRNGPSPIRATRTPPTPTSTAWSPTSITTWGSFANAWKNSGWPKTPSLFS